MLKKDHLVFLQANFSHRSIDSIKKRLQHLGWKPSQDIQQEPPLTTTVSPQIPTSSRPNIQVPPATTTPRTISHRSPPETSITLTPAPRRTTNWNKEEDDELQAQANRIWRPDMLKKDLAKSLATITKRRTAEAVKKRLHKLKWVNPGPTPASCFHKSTPAAGGEIEYPPNRGETSPVISRKEPRNS